MRHLRTSTLFAFGAFLLITSLMPACGKKSIRSEQIEPTPAVTESPSVSPSETPTPSTDTSVGLVPEASPTSSPTVTATATVSDYSYVPETVTMEEDADTVSAKVVQKPKPVKATKPPVKSPAVPTATPQPVATDIPTPIPTSNVFGAIKSEPMSTDNPPSVKSTSKLWSWLLLLLVVVGAIWYFWRRNQDDDSLPSKPSAPLGGLSPVSGFFSDGSKKTSHSDKAKPKR